MPTKDFKTWKCSFSGSSWRTCLLQVSQTTVSTGKWVHTFFHCAPTFFLPENNSKQKNWTFFTGRGVVCFSLVFGTWRVKPAAFAARQRDGRSFTTTSLEGNETFGFTVLDGTHRSTGREGRVKGLKVTVFNSKGFHTTVAQTKLRAAVSASCWSSPYCLHCFFTWALHLLDR